MPNLILAVAMLIFSVASVMDAGRITSAYRVPGAFDLLGPDRYLTGAGILIGVLGLALLVQSILALRTATSSRVPSLGSDESRRHLLIAAILVGYAVLIPVLGYTAATFVFFPFAFRIMGVSDWRYVALWSVASTAAFYLSFVVLADMPLPKGLVPIE